jgi:Cu(I)/Ag(I) efflux system periplasmic protein CusF
MRPRHRVLVLAGATLALAGCAAYQPPPLTAAHPAHPDAPAARAIPASQTLAYTPAEAAAVRALAPAAPARGDQRPSGPAAKTVVGEGEVVATTPATGQIVVDHGEIKGFMDAMTMGYRIDPPSLLATVKPGDKIRFTIDVGRRAIVHVEKLP